MITPGEAFIWTFTICGCVLMAAATLALTAYGYHQLIKEIEK